MTRRGRLASVAITAFLAGGGAALAAGACGTGVSSRYESDVRFERCMALDWQGDVDPQIRHGCWDEWVRYFTRGQTKDRIAYAKKELDELGPTESASAAASETATPVHATPDPTSVFIPPPVMISPDAGVDPDGGADAADSAPDAGPPKNACMTSCEAQSEACEVGCKGTSWCFKSCAVQRANCIGYCP